MNTTTNQTETGTDSQQVAETILQQINAGDFWARARWGVKTALSTERHGAPALMLNCTKGIKIIVRLNANDTYDVEVGRMGRGVERFDYKVAAEASEVYAEDLARVIDLTFSEAFGSL